MSFVYVVLSVALVVAVRSVDKFAKSRKYVYPAPLAGIAVVLLVRSLVLGKIGVEGKYLVRQYSGGAGGTVWFFFVILLAAFLVRQFAYDHLPDWMTGHNYAELVKFAGYNLLLWAIIAPFSGLRPIARLLLIAGVLVWAGVMLKRTLKEHTASGATSPHQTPVALYAGIITAMLFAVVSFASTGSAFWRQDVPRDFWADVCATKVVSDHQCAQHVTSKSKKAAPRDSVQSHPIQITYTPHVSKNRRGQTTSVLIVEECPSLDACLASMDETNFLTASMANHSHAPAEVQQDVNGVSRGAVARRTPNSKTDAQLGAKKGYPCLVPGSLVNVGMYDTGTTSGKLVCVG